MTRTKIKETLKANGLNPKHIFDLSSIFVEKFSVEGIPQSSYLSPSDACIAVKLFGARLRFTKDITFLNDHYYTPFIGYDPTGTQ